METDDWMPRVESLEEGVKKINDSLLGTLDGRPGLRAQMDLVMDLTRKNTEQLESLRLDKAKVAGIVVATGTLVGVGLKLLHL
jgi:hypothetical protein